MQLFMCFLESLQNLQEKTCDVNLTGKSLTGL